MKTRRFKGLAEDQTAFRSQSVVGTYSDEPADFVQHVAILQAGCDLPAHSDVEVFHMGPPIVTGRASATHSKAESRISVDLASDIELTPNEIAKMTNWCASIDKQKRATHPLKQYTAQPHMRWEKSEEGRKIYQRFSCAGYVLECYAAAEIHLLVTDPSEIPEVDDFTLRSAYPDLNDLDGMSDKVRKRIMEDELGLTGDGRVLLAGYVFSSLARYSDEDKRPAPHQVASVSEAYFA